MPRFSPRRKRLRPGTTTRRLRPGHLWEETSCSYLAQAELLPLRPTCPRKTSTSRHPTRRIARNTSRKRHRPHCPTTPGHLPSTQRARRRPRVSRLRQRHRVTLRQLTTLPLTPAQQFPNEPRPTKATTTTRRATAPPRRPVVTDLRTQLTPLRFLIYPKRRLRPFRNTIRRCPAPRRTVPLHPMPPHTIHPLTRRHPIAAASTAPSRMGPAQQSRPTLHLVARPRPTPPIRRFLSDRTTPQTIRRPRITTEHLGPTPRPPDSHPRRHQLRQHCSDTPRMRHYQDRRFVPPEASHLGVPTEPLKKMTSRKNAALKIQSYKTSKQSFPDDDRDRPQSTAFTCLMMTFAIFEVPMPRRLRPMVLTLPVQVVVRGTMLGIRLASGKKAIRRERRVSGQCSKQRWTIKGSAGTHTPNPTSCLCLRWITWTTMTAAAVISVVWTWACLAEVTLEI